MPQDKTLQFDGLRGLACLLVLIPHMRYFGFYLTEFFAFARFAQFGLYLFFFLSAYLISKSVFSDSREGLWQVWPTYAIRRFLRIVPLYLAVLLLDYSFFHFYFGTMGVRDLSALLGHIFFQEGRSALWTMPVEVRFYVLLVPLMFAITWALRLSELGKRVAITLMAVTAIAWHLYTFLVDRSGAIATLGIHAYAPYFVFGVLCAAMRVAFASALATTSDRWWNIVGASALALFIAQNPYWWQMLFPFEGWRYDPSNINALTFDVYLTWRTHAMVILVALIFLAADRTSGWMKQLFSATPLVVIGRYSYGIYLLHMPIVFFVKDRVTGDPQLGMAAILGLTIALAVVLHYLVERPGIRLSNRLVALAKTNVTEGRFRHRPVSSQIGA